MEGFLHVHENLLQRTFLTTVHRYFNNNHIVENNLLVVINTLIVVYKTPLVPNTSGILLMQILLKLQLPV